MADAPISYPTRRAMTEGEALAGMATIDLHNMIHATIAAQLQQADRLHKNAPTREYTPSPPREHTPPPRVTPVRRRTPMKSKRLDQKLERMLRKKPDAPSTPRAQESCWTCSKCGESNKEGRTQCNCCGARKPAAGHAETRPAPQREHTPVREPPASPQPAPRAQESCWICSICLESNKGGRTQCNFCGKRKGTPGPPPSRDTTPPTPRPAPQHGQTPSREPPASPQPAPSAQESRWVCSKCGECNKEGRTQCNCCGARNPAAVHAKTAEPAPSRDTTPPASPRPAPQRDNTPSRARAPPPTSPRTPRESNSPRDLPSKQALSAVMQQLEAVRRLATKEQRKQAFKELQREWHPDKNPQNAKVATEVFQKLQAEQKRVLG